MRYHRNLHNAKRGGPQWVRTERGRVAEYLETVTLVNVTTRLQPAGVRKCQERGVRSVCAYLDGEPRPNLNANGGQGNWQRIQFDPRSDNHFLADGQPWNAAAAVKLEQDGSAYALFPTWKE